MAGPSPKLYHSSFAALYEGTKTKEYEICMAYGGPIALGGEELFSIRSKVKLTLLLLGTYPSNLQNFFVGFE